MSTETHREHQRKGPFWEALRALPKEQRKEFRRQFRATLEKRAEEQALRGRKRRARHARREPLMHLGVRIAGWLPLPVAAWFGEWTMALAAALLPALRHRVEYHVRLALGAERDEAELRAITARALRLIGRGAASYLVLHRMGAERLLARVEVADEAHLDAALADGHGAIVVSAHYGLFEAGACHLGSRRNGIAVGRDAGDTGPTRLLIGMRADLGCPTIERGDARAVVRALRDNRPVAIVADHDVARLNGLFVPFFGRLAHTPIGPGSLCVRTGAPIVPLLVEWIDRTHYRVRYFPPLRPRADLGREEAAYELTWRFTRLFEDRIRAEPAPWLWLHKRWETRPEQRPDLPVWQPPTAS